MYDVTDFTVFRSGQIGQVTIFTKDPNTGQLTDVYGNSTYELVDINTEATIVSHTFPPGGDSSVIKLATGTYQVSIDTGVYTGEYLAAARCVMQGEVLGINTYFKSVSSKHFKYAALLRGQVDKARKGVADSIANLDQSVSAPSIKLFYGYTDAHLIFYLERGMQYINAISPYTSISVDTFPFASFGSILIDSGVIAALESQGIFAIDTDFDYSLGSNSLVIDHFGKLNTALATLLERFTKTATNFKQLYRTKGVLLHQFMPGGVRDMRYLSVLPSGFWSRIWSGGI